MKKMKWNPFKITVLVIVAFLALISLVNVVLLVNEYLIVYESDARLVVEEAYFEKDNEAGDDTLLNVFVMVTNDGDRECKSHLRAFIIDRDTNIAMDDSTTNDVKIKGHSTSEVDFVMAVPSDARYRVEILVFKDDMISVKGVGFLDLSLEGKSGQDYRTTMDDEESAERNLKTPFIGPAAIIMAAGVTVLLFRRWRR